MLIKLNVELPVNRDLIFESKQLNTLTLSIYVINYNLSHLMIRNNINLPVILIRYVRLNKILEYKVEGYFQININLISITNRLSR